MQTKKIAISNLSMWDDNVRFDYISQNEKECIEKIFSDKKLKKKTLVLLDDILNNKVIRESLIVYVENNLLENKYIVLDGNRRISLFKIIKYKDLIKKFKIDESKINKLNNLIKEVECNVYDNLEQAYDHVEKRHCGENNGAGIVKWMPKNIERMHNKKNFIPEYSTGYKIMEFYKNTNDMKYSYVKNNIKDKSTIDRIFERKIVYKDIFNLNSYKDYDLDNQEHINKINEMLTLFYENNMNVTNVYTIDKIKNSFKDIIPLNKIRQMDIDSIQDKEIKQIDINIIPAYETKNYNESVNKTNEIAKNEIQQTLLVNSTKCEIDVNNIETQKGKRNQYRSSSKIYLFCWKSEKIRIKNDVFNYYLKKCIDYYSNGIEKNGISTVLAPYFYRLLLESAFRELSSKIKEEKIKKLFTKNTSFNSYTEQREIDSALTINRISGLFELEQNMDYHLRTEKDEIKEMIKILRSYGISQKTSNRIQGFIDDINEIVHGKNINIDKAKLEEIDTITLNIIKIISCYLNIERGQ